MAIGPTLRAARERKGYSISAVAELTNMMTRVIEDLENDNYKRIAAPIYGRGFIKLYAGLLGLDPQPLIDDYMAAVTGTPKPSSVPAPHSEPRATVPPPPSAPAMPPEAAPPPVMVTPPPIARGNVKPAQDKSALAQALEKRMAQQSHAADLILINPGGSREDEGDGKLHGVVVVEEEAFEITDPVDEAPDADSGNPPLHGVTIFEEEFVAEGDDVPFPEPEDESFAAPTRFPAAFDDDTPEPTRFPVAAESASGGTSILDETPQAAPSGEPDLFSLAASQMKSKGIETRPIGSPLSQPIPPSGPDRSQLFSRPRNAPIFSRPSLDEEVPDTNGWRVFTAIIGEHAGKIAEKCKKSVQGAKMPSLRGLRSRNMAEMKKIAVIAVGICAVVIVFAAIVFTFRSGDPGAETSPAIADAPLVNADTAIPVGNTVEMLAPPPPPYFD